MLPPMDRDCPEVMFDGLFCKYLVYFPRNAFEKNMYVQ